MELLGADHPQTLSSMISLANLYVRIKLYSEAEPLYVECYKKYAKGLGKDHLYTRRMADKIKGCRAKMYTNSVSSIDSGDSRYVSLCQFLFVFFLCSLCLFVCLFSLSPITILIFSQPTTT